jgi:YHS domain-containing protein
MKRQLCAAAAMCQFMTVSSGRRNAMSGQGVPRRLVVAAVAGFALGGMPWAAGGIFGGAKAQSAEPAVYTGIVEGVALGGYDAVAYHAEGAPRRGSADYSHQWQGAEWRFSSAENRDRFAADPEAFAPRFGGYCAWAVAEGYTAHGDPHVWAIVDGQLYLNYSARIQRRWERDVPGFIARAETNWPGVLGQ